MYCSFSPRYYEDLWPSVLPQYKNSLFCLVVSFLYNYSEFLWRWWGWESAATWRWSSWCVPRMSCQKGRIFLLYSNICVELIELFVLKNMKKLLIVNFQEHRKTEILLETRLTCRSAFYLLAALGQGTRDYIQSVVVKMSKMRWLQLPPFLYDKLSGVLWQNIFGVLSKEPTETCEFLPSKQAAGSRPRDLNQARDVADL